MILSVTLNPSLDQTLFVENFTLGDTNRVGRVEIDAGGKGINLSRIAAELGANTLATGFVGGQTGAFIKNLLSDHGVHHSFAETKEPTRTNFNIESGNEVPPTTLNAKGPRVQVDEWGAFCAHFQSHLLAAEWVCLCGSLPPGAPPDAYVALTRMAKSSGKRVLVDADGEAMKLALADKPDLIKPNLKEAERLLGRAITDPAEGVSALRTMMGHEDAIAIISMGEDGAVLACADGVFRGESPNVEAVSSVGSGDSMLGAFLARLSAGDEIPIAFQWGLAAGAATATTNGTQIGTRAVIELLFAEAKVER